MLELWGAGVEVGSGLTGMIICDVCETLGVGVGATVGVAVGLTVGFTVGLGVGVGVEVEVGVHLKSWLAVSLLSTPSFVECAHQL